jgi:hypothetical protein
LVVPKYHPILPAAGLAMLATLIVAADLMIPRTDENVILLGDWRQSHGAIDADVAQDLVQSGWSPLRVIGDNALLVAPITGVAHRMPAWVRLALRAKGVLGCAPKA